MTQVQTKDTCWENSNTSQQVEKGKYLYHVTDKLFSDGPAIWVNDTLTRGQTNQSLTYNNELLTLGEKAKDDTYEIHNLELFIL